MTDKTQDTELIKILDEVERYLKRRGLNGTAFGLAVSGNSALLTKMRRGDSLYSKTMSAIRKYMKDNPPPKRAARANKGN